MKLWMLPLLVLLPAVARAHPLDEDCLAGPTGTPTVALDLNRAPAASLARLPGVGPKLAARIVGRRTKRPFRSVQEILRVKGIGVRTLRRVRPWLVVRVPRAIRASSDTR